MGGAAAVAVAAAACCLLLLLRMAGSYVDEPQDAVGTAGHELSASWAEGQVIRGRKIGWKVDDGWCKPSGCRTLICMRLAQREAAQPQAIAVGKKASVVRYAGCCDVPPCLRHQPQQVLWRRRQRH